MAAVASGLLRREVAVDVREARTGEMPGRVLVFAPALRPGEVVTHVDDDVRRVGQPRGELRGRDERGEHPGSSVVAHLRRRIGARLRLQAHGDDTGRDDQRDAEPRDPRQPSAKSAMPSTDENTMPL